MKTASGIGNPIVQRLTHVRSQIHEVLWSIRQLLNEVSPDRAGLERWRKQYIPLKGQ